MPFFLLIVLSTTVVGYLSFVNGEQAVHSAVKQLNYEIDSRIKGHIENFLDQPLRINQMVSASVRQDLLDLNNPNMMEKHFWEQVRIYESVNSLYFGNIGGGIIDAGRETDNSMYIMATDDFKKGQFRKYRTDSSGKRENIIWSLSFFDSTTRPWYSAAVKNGKLSWSDVYILSTGQDMAIAASSPVYSKNGVLLGVVSVDIFLSKIGNFLKGLSIGKTGISYIVDEAGYIIASSTDERPFTANDSGKLTRLMSLKSSRPLISRTSFEIIKNYGEFKKITGDLEFSLKVNGKNNFVKLSRLNEKYNLKWYCVTVIPSSDFMKEIHAGNRNTILLIIITLAVMILLGFITAQMISLPIQQLNRTARALAEGKWEERGKESRISEIMDLSGSFNNMVGQLKGTLQDLTLEILERKRVEDDLRSSEEKFKAIFNSTFQLTGLLSPEGIVMESNQASLEFAGVTRDDVIGMPFWETEWWKGNEDMVLKLKEAVSKASSGEFVRYEVELRGSGGKSAIMDFSIKPIYSDGHVVLLIPEARDITEKKMVEKERIELAERLQASQKMEALGTLAGGIAHDLNNVLGIMVGYSEMLLYDIDKSNPVRPYAIHIMDASRRAAAIVQDMLTLARRGVQNRKVLNLNRIIEDCKVSPEFLEMTSNRGDILVEFDLKDDLMNISGSSVHLEKTVMNLVINAFEAMPHGGKILIKTDNRYLEKLQGYEEVKEGEYVMLCVSDTGEGISQTDIGRIFEPFYTKKIMGKSGTGLGLAVVWGTVKDHDGYVNVTSEPGKNTVFTLYFPVSQKDPMSEDVSPSVKDILGNGETVLVVDDVDGQRELAAGIMRRLNYRVHTAASGEEALAWIMENQADIVILDMIMDPGIDGYETFRRMREIRPDQRAVIVSGYSETDRVQLAREIGAGAYIRKPYIIEKLGMAVKGELRRK